MQLKGFERITLKPGEKRTVEFTVTPEMLSILNIDMHRVVEPGVFELMVGPSSDKTNNREAHRSGHNGETGRPPLPPPPAGSESGMVQQLRRWQSGSQLRLVDSSQRQMNGGQIYFFACRWWNPARPTPRELCR